MRKLFSAFMGVISVLTLIVYTLFLGIFLFLAILLRFLLPTALARTYANPLIVEVALIWVGGILWWLRRIHRVQLDMAHDLTLDMQQWNLIIANHQSWLDIFVLFFVTYRKLPVLKFFIKSQLIWVPVAGAAWWALDYPFMSRYSKSYLEKHPEKAGKDLETTKRACEKFSEQPTSVVNFLEGTRFTKAKHQQQQSPYRHLLKPKAGGVAFA
ncbi:MAG: acetyltransferase, partial [Reinekea sp.]|nr:acetyltransferase [Reinekea sp.]